MYETPIRLIMADTEHVLEGEIFKAVQRYYIDVNKEELIKALQYDRDQYDKGYQDGLNADKWIPCSERLPEEPKKNPIFEGKPLELYLVSVKNTDYPFRAFWNGKFFTDGFGKVDVIAWQPLPEPYKGEQE